MESGVLKCTVRTLTRTPDRSHGTYVDNDYSVIFKQYAPCEILVSSCLVLSGSHSEVVPVRFESTGYYQPESPDWTVVVLKPRGSKKPGDRGMTGNTVGRYISFLIHTIYTKYLFGLR